MSYLGTTGSFPPSSWLQWTQQHQQRAAISNMAGQEDPVQREIHQDWANREYIEVITSSIKKIADFLNSFGKNLIGSLTDTHATVENLAIPCRSMLASSASTLVAWYGCFELPLPVSV